MEIGDLIEWSWPDGTQAAFKRNNGWTTWRGIIIGERMEGLVRVLKVVDKLGAIEVRADEAEVISESR